MGHLYATRTVCLSIRVMKRERNAVRTLRQKKTAVACVSVSPGCLLLVEGMDGSSGRWRGAERSRGTHVWHVSMLSDSGKKKERRRGWCVCAGDAGEEEEVTRVWWWCLLSFVLLAASLPVVVGVLVRCSSSRALSFLLFSSTRRSAIESFQISSSRRKGGEKSRRIAKELKMNCARPNEWRRKTG